VSGVEVRNGAVIGGGGVGLRLGESGTVRNLRARMNRLGGISMGSHSAISDSSASANMFGGIVGLSLGDDSAFRESTITRAGRVTGRSPPPSPDRRSGCCRGSRRR